MKDILFLSCAYSDNQKDLFQKESKRGYQFAAQNLQESIIEGLINNGVKTEVLSIPSLSTYPLGCNLPYVKDADFILNGQKLGKSLGFLNIPFIRNLYPSRCNTFIDKWNKQNISKSKWILVYGLHANLLKIAVKAKLRNPNLKICVIIPDLPENMGYNKYLKALGMQKKYIDYVNKTVSLFDAFIPLAAPMMEKLGIEQKPYIVMEGIFSDVSEPTTVEKDNYKVILYTGNLNKRYGIISLLDAFQLLQDAQDYRLWIRGNGDAMNEVLLRSNTDDRIKYWDSMSKTDLIKLQKKATLLVNCVPPSMSFTRYFFPSKTMDYLASGTPTIMHKLDCLPKEYFDHLYFFEGESVDSMAKSIRMICEKSKEERFDFGKKASEFIYVEKNSTKQTAKIINFLKSI